MPGPYCEASEVAAQVKASQGMATDATQASQWSTLSARAVDRGYQRMLSILGKRGFGPNQVDQWSGRVSYNLAYAVALAFRFGGFGASYEDRVNSDELRDLDKELSDEGLILFDDSGTAILPDPSATVTAPTHGRMEEFDADFERAAEW